ncbi:Uncharacterised protein [Vibrio cholerae]|nr:Uncharacterised protein [Vibrio cholerae]
MTLLMGRYSSSSSNKLLILFKAALAAYQEN